MNSSKSVSYGRRPGQWLFTFDAEFSERPFVYLRPSGGEESFASIEEFESSTELRIRKADGRVCDQFGVVVYEETTVGHPRTGVFVRYMARDGYRFVPVHLAVYWLERQPVDDVVDAVELALTADGYAWLLPKLREVRGRAIGPYVLNRVIGYGARKLVFAATRGNIVVAIKVPWLVGLAPQELQQVSRRRQLVEHEAGVLRQFAIAEFPTFIELLYDQFLYDCNEWHGKYPYLASEFVLGRTLSQVATANEMTVNERVSKMVAGLCCVVAVEVQLVRRGYLLIDVKLSNIIVDNGRARYVDGDSVALLVEGVVRRPRFNLPSLPPDLRELAMTDPKGFVLSEADILECVKELFRSAILEILDKEDSSGRHVDLPGDAGVLGLLDALRDGTITSLTDLGQRLEAGGWVQG